MKSIFCCAAIVWKTLLCSLNKQAHLVPHCWNGCIYVLHFFNQLIYDNDEEYFVKASKICVHWKCIMRWFQVCYSRWNVLIFQTVYFNLLLFTLSLCYFMECMYNVCVNKCANILCHNWVSQKWRGMFRLNVSNLKSSQQKLLSLCIKFCLHKLCQTVVSLMKLLSNLSSK